MNTFARLTTKWGVAGMVIGILTMGSVASAWTMSQTVANKIDSECRSVSFGWDSSASCSGWFNNTINGLLHLASAIPWAGFIDTSLFTSNWTLVDGSYMPGGHSGVDLVFQNAQGQIRTIIICGNGNATGGGPATTCTSTPNICGMTGSGFTNSVLHCTAQTPPDSACTATACPTDQHWDATQHQCIANTCPAGQHWDTSVSACIINTICNSGYHLDVTTNTCIADAQSSNACPTGYIGTAPNCTLAASCPIGYTGTPPNCTPSACVSQNICSGSDVVDSCTGNLIQHCSVACQGGACTIPAPQVVTWHVAPILVKAGKTSTATWDVKYTTSCTVTDTRGDTWTGLSGSKASSPLLAQTIFTLDCTPLPGAPSGHVTRTTTVNIAPIFEEQ